MRRMNTGTAKMARNQNMAFHPRYWLRRPPIIGDRVGLKTVLTEEYAT
jgi:hypothetical protein